jgi:hypothetical protein
MKDKLFFMELTIFFSCQSGEGIKNPIWDYIKSPSDNRVFQLTTDSSFATRLFFIKQNSKLVNDTTWEFEFYWTRYDSLPIQKSIERYSTNTLELLEQSFFEPNSLIGASEVKAEITGKKYFSLVDSNNIYDFQYKFKTDPYLIMKIHTQFSHKFEQINTLGNDNLDCLVIISKDQITLEYSDKRKDTTMFENSRRVYAKGKGLIFFEQSAGRRKLAYKLIE